MLPGRCVRLYTIILGPKIILRAGRETKRQALTTPRVGSRTLHRMRGAELAVTSERSRSCTELMRRIVRIQMLVEKLALVGGPSKHGSHDANSEHCGHS